MDCNLMSFNYKRARIFGYKMTLTGEMIGKRSTPHIHNEIQYSGRYEFISCSATMAESADSVRFKFIGYSHEAERWDKVRLPYSDEQEDKAWAESCRMADLPIDWLKDKDKYLVNGLFYRGENAVKYDKIGQLCHLSQGQIWKPSKDKTWCTKAVAAAMYKADVYFWYLILRYLNEDELRPDQLHYIAGYFYGKYD